MSYDNSDQNVDRRGFLKAAAVTAVAAAAAGTGAAFLVDLDDTPTITSVQAPPSLPNTTIQTGQDTSDLMARLAASQAENVRLQAELTALQRQLDASQNALGAENNAVGEAYQGQLEEANAQIGQLSGQVGILSGLVALYEQLEGIDLETVASNGIASVSSVLDELFANVPSVEEGLAAGQQAIAEFEAQVPLVDNGRRWLAGQIDIVSGYYSAVEEALSDAVEAVGSFLQMLNQWFQDVLKWLPFGVGDKAARIMDAMTNLLAETPNTISGVRTNVVQPLDAWFGLEGEETKLQRRLIKPVRDDAINRAATAVAQTHSVKDVYQNQLAQPVQTNVEQRNTIRQMIATYRQEHQI